ncbi:SOUL heme-binding protein [Arthrobacter ulcerisalmonis]|uniref:SOUL heme-binding protein n=1 Tax=Arthrobacter ulcerisalmonis TaxID=2483813 RepID=A0A3P5WTK8_9MICC|nr:SOUL heme-binding protein [Arthrobacter ulcerisalmonis]
MQVRTAFDRAGNAAFRSLFNYISGSNVANQKLAMTAPVIQGSGASQKLAMTAPVLQSGPAGNGEPGEFVVAFVLPAGLTADSAPVPTNPEVRIRDVPGSLAAALRFSGNGSEAAFAKRTEGLLAALALAGLTPTGSPRFARFDPPFKPWFLRHNEVVQDVAETGVSGG